jgi:hypothetical protein
LIAIYETSKAKINSTTYHKWSYTMLELDSTTQSTDLQDDTQAHYAAKVKVLSSLVLGGEHSAQNDLRTVYHAISGEAIYQVSSHGIDMHNVVQYAKQKGAVIAHWTSTSVLMP